MNPIPDLAKFEDNCAKEEMGGLNEELKDGF